MKKLTAFLMILIMTALTLIPAMTVYADGDTDTQYYIAAENGRTVNLRSRPEGSLMARLGVGKPVKLLGDTGSGWVKISAKVDGEILTGYIMSDYLSDEDPTEVPQTFAEVRRFKVAVAPSKGDAGHVNLRAEPTVDSACLRYLRKGAVLTVIAESNAWYKVRTAAGTVGYVVKAFVDKFALTD